MFPAQALAEAMLANGWRVKLSTDARGARYTGGFPEAVEIEQVSSATFARGGVLAKVLVPLKILAGVLGMAAKMLGQRPAVVVGFGGYPAIPAMAAAWLLRRPRMIHEQNGVLGRVNEVFAKRVGVVACGTWPTIVPSGARAEPTGNPVRAAVLEQAAAVYREPGQGPTKIVVIGGSQGARILSDVVPAAIAELPGALLENLLIVQQARDEDTARVTQAYENIGVRAEVKPFLNVPRQFAEAQLVISRAGASSLADISVIGRPSILVPYAAAASDHQTANARGLVEAGAAISMPEAQFTPSALAHNIRLVLETPDAARKMVRAALEHGRPDATERLVHLVETLAEKGRLI